METEQKRHKRLPPWFRIRLATTEKQGNVRALLRQQQLHTVCESAACPNRTECWNSGTATFLLLGSVCTRNCGFCNIPKGKPLAVDPGEPERIAYAVKALGLSHAVITSVTRDDLADGGAHLFAETIQAIHAKVPDCRVEVLIPDFQGSPEALQVVLDAKPDVLNHNLETVPALYDRVRPGADYARSLNLLHQAHGSGVVTKSGLMVGLGEGRNELSSTLGDLRNARCGLLTIGQYLRPTARNLAVQKYYHPDEFDELKKQAYGLGFRHVSAGPLVRSSYHAGYATNSLLPKHRSDCR